MIGQGQTIDLLLEASSTSENPLEYTTVSILAIVAQGPTPVSEKNMSA